MSWYDYIWAVLGIGLGLWAITIVSGYIYIGLKSLSWAIKKWKKSESGRQVREMTLVIVTIIFVLAYFIYQFTKPQLDYYN